MTPTSLEALAAVDVVKQYALGLSTMNLDLIVPVLDTEFKFVYRINNGGGHGISTDARYIGHLYKKFAEMKKEGLTINTDFCYLKYKGVSFLSIKLLPPHYRSIIYPMDYRLESVRNRVPENEVYLLPRIKNGLLCKIECYTTSELHNYRIELLKNEIIL